MAAQAPALDVRMGLWEITNKTTLGGQMPQMDLSKLPPEQRARVEESMKAAMGEHTNVTKSCITKEKLEKSVFMMDSQPGQKCSQQIVTNTRAALDANLTCTGDRPMKGQMHIDALSPTSVKGTVTAAVTDQGRTMTANIALAGKWLGADCGDVK
jgi:hypothetical protein